MFKFIAFNHGYVLANEQDQCIALRHVNGANQLDVSFPFMDDIPVIRLSICEALTLRNAIDDLVRPLLLEASKGDGQQ